jgi:guanylate kinase
LIFIVSGPGGVGKDTVVRRVIAQDPTLSLSRSWTTRAPRPGETDADYRFATRDEFEAEIERGGFLEWAEYLGNLYGTPLPDPKGSNDVILVIEVQGAAQVLERVPGAVMVLLVPPSRAAQEARLQARGDSPEQIERRLTEAVAEEGRGRELAQHVVVNDDVGRAVAEVAGILAGHRKTPLL